VQGTTTSIRRIVGRAAIGAVAVSAVVGISATSAFAGKGHNAASSMSCTLSTTGFGAPLTLSGSGYAPNTSYGVVFVWPTGAGTGGTGTTSDASGNFSVSTYAYWVGAYTATVTDGRGRSLASCSTTVS
jgi:hypothetical protein